MSQHMERMNYHGDARVLAALRTRRYRVLAAHNGVAIVQFERGSVTFDCLVEDGILDESHDGTFAATVTREACDMCDGKGSHVNPSIDAGGFHAEDHDDAENYRSGVYDVRCYECGGSGVYQFATVLDEKVEAWLREAREEDAYHDAERAAERRFGC